MCESSSLTDLENELRQKLLQDEAAYFSKKKANVESLWCHSSRVASLAEHLGKKEGVNPVVCRLAGLFHDSGKFQNGEYHDDNVPEEQHSAEIFRSMSTAMNVDNLIVEQVEQSILQLYSKDPNPTHLTKILFDADNLDKLGLLGVSNYFTKIGLRGGGLGESALYQLTIELTYARYASKRFLTRTGKDIAKKRSVDAVDFFKRLLCRLREEGVFDFQIHEIEYRNLIIDVVEPSSCRCGNTLTRDIKEKEGIKCTELHVHCYCEMCGFSNELKFCAPE